MQLSVVILNYNVRYFLELCLKSVKESLIGINSEIIVVDNNSPDDSCEMVSKLFPDVILIKNKDNVGFSKANNQGVKIAKGKYVCILNPDTVVAEDTFKQLINFAESKTNLGIIGCRLIDGTGNYLPESKRNVPIVKVAAQKMLGNGEHYYANHIKEFDIGKVDILVGAFMFLKTETYKEIAGFDEDYFMYGEDIDISYKLLKKGYDNYYYGKTTIIHYKGESTLKDRRYAQRFYGAMQLFYRKHFNKNILFDIAVWFGLKAAFLLRQSPSSKTLKIEKYILFSDTLKKDIEATLSKEIETSSELKTPQPNTEIIFDANYISYKDIIKHLTSLNTHKDLSFKIRPKNSKFIIGSDDSINRGEVILLNQ